MPGPSGPAGPVGPSAGGGRLNYIVAINSSGGAVQALPAIVGTNPLLSPPSLACYISDGLSPTVWLNKSDGYSTTSTSCGLVFGDGVWNAVMINSIPGWFAAFVVIY